jgi:hypothetical protein
MVTSLGVAKQNDGKSNIESKQTKANISQRLGLDIGDRFKICSHVCVIIPPFCKGVVRGDFFILANFF